MEDNKANGNNEAQDAKKTAPSSITVNVRQRMALDEIKAKKSRQSSKGLLVALIAVGSLLVVGIIVVGVLLITQPKTANVELVPTASQTAAPQATPSATTEPTEAPTPLSTTPPEESDDLSAIFEAPVNPILEESQNQ